MDKWVVWFFVQLLSELLQLQCAILSTYTVYRCWYVNHDFFAIGLGLVIDAIICIFLGFVGWQYASVRSEDDLHTGESEYSWRHYLQIYRYPMWIICVMNLGVIENYPDFDSLWFKFWIQAPLFFLAWLLNKASGSIEHALRGGRY